MTLGQLVFWINYSFDKSFAWYAVPVPQLSTLHNLELFRIKNDDKAIGDNLDLLPNCLLSSATVSNRLR